MSTKRRKSRNNKINFGMPGSGNQTKQFKQIPSLERNQTLFPKGMTTNNKLTKKVARLLVASLALLVIILVVMGATGVF